MAYTAGGYDSDVEGGGPYEGNIGGAFTDKAVRLVFNDKKNFALKF